MARRHLLLPETRANDPATVADAVVALHSTDPVTVYLSVAARLADPTLGAVDDALYGQRTLIRHHAMRRTLWVARPDVMRRMHAAATRALAVIERRRTLQLLREGGVADPEEWLDSAREQVVADLHRHGASTTRDIGERVPSLCRPLLLAPGTRWAATSSAHTRVLLVLGFQGVILRARPTGTWVSGAYRWVVAEDWLPGGLGDLDLHASAADLVAAYLRRFGPVTTADLAWWMGWTRTLTRTALASAGAVAVDLDGQPGWVAPDDEPDADASPRWVAALPGLDPTTMGWKERDWYLPAQAAAAFDSNGNAGATLWVDGRVVGIWAQSKSGELRTHYFEQVAADRRAELDERLRAIGEVVGATRFTLRFPNSLHRELVS